MASLPAGSCCYQGVKHEGEAKGSFSQLNDFEIYTSSPADKSTENGILVYVLPLAMPQKDQANKRKHHGCDRPPLHQRPAHCRPVCR